MTQKTRSTQLTANQLVAFNLRRIRTQRELTQEQAAELLEPYLGQRWSKATFSAAERSAEPGTRAREFSGDEILAFARVFGVSVSWFFLPRDDEVEIPAVSCGGPTTIEAPELLDAALPHGAFDHATAPRLQSLMLRPKLRGEVDERIREAALARVNALAKTAQVSGDVTNHAANLRRLANALEGADDQARHLFADAYRNLNRNEGNDA
jgi:transcriptional regulator with XRE-family HTH domain